MLKSNIIFAFLILSSILTTIPVDGFSDQTTQIIIFENPIESSTDSQVVTHHSISFHEKVAMTTDDSINNSDGVLETTYSSHKEIKFEEKLKLTVSELDEKIINPAIGNNDRIAILDRVNDNKQSRTSSTVSGLKLSEIESQFQNKRGAVAERLAG